jgi:hypothetical protein
MKASYRNIEPAETEPPADTFVGAPGSVEEPPAPLYPPAVVEPAPL